MPLTAQYRPALLSLVIAAACSGGTARNSDVVAPVGNGGNSASSTASSGNGNASATRLGTGGSSDVGIAVNGGPSGGGAAVACAAKTADAKRRPVMLAFAFDVSGSMGQLDKKWHDPALKWEPVVAATEAFFAADSTGVSASLTFFPAKDLKCSATSYAKPDVAMTALPSQAFADAITAMTPKSSDDWRGGTPTLAVLRGVFGQLDSVAIDSPDANLALVLVTDGYPQGCDGENDIGLVVDEVARHPTIPTYVIGVENPPIDGAPDTVSNLNGIAQSGGTDSAFLIQTGDPTATSRQLSAVIERIRGASISCELSLPNPPSGESLDIRQVNVTYRSADMTTPFVYDPECKSDRAWHYDEVARPKSVILCPSDCATVMADNHASVMVEFGCAQRTPFLQ